MTQCYMDNCETELVDHRDIVCWGCWQRLNIHQQLLAANMRGNFFMRRNYIRKMLRENLEED